MNKKRVAIVITALFLLISILIFGMVGIFNMITDNNVEEKNHANVNTSQIQGETKYNHKDVKSEYEQMLEKAKEQDELAKTKAKKEEKKEKEKEDRKEKYNYDEIEENGKKYIADDVGGKTPKGAIGTGKPLSSKPSNINSNKNIKPFYQKYETKVDNSIINKKTKETALLKDFLKNRKHVQIVNSSVSTKGNRIAIAYQKDSKGKVLYDLITISNRAGTARKEHIKNMHYIVSFNDKYIDDNLSGCYALLKTLGLHAREDDFKNLYQKYKNGKLTNEDYTKSYSIGYDGLGVTVEW